MVSDGTLKIRVVQGISALDLTEGVNNAVEALQAQKKFIVHIGEAGVSSTIDEHNNITRLWYATIYYQEDERNAKDGAR